MGGYCPNEIHEYYAVTAESSVDNLIKQFDQQAVTAAPELAQNGQPELFPINDILTSSPQLFGVGVWTETEAAASPFWATVIVVSLVHSPDCDCADTPCLVPT